MVGLLQQAFGKDFRARVMIVVSIYLTFCTCVGTYLKFEKMARWRLLLGLVLSVFRTQNRNFPLLYPAVPGQSALISVPRSSSLVNISLHDSNQRPLGALPIPAQLTN